MKMKALANVLISSIAAFGFVTGSTVAMAADVCGEGYIDRYVSEYQLVGDTSLYIHVDSTGFSPSPFPASAFLQNWNGMNMIRISLGTSQSQWDEKLAALKMAMMAHLPVRIVGISNCMATADNMQVMVCTTPGDCRRDQPN